MTTTAAMTSTMTSTMMRGEEGGSGVWSSSVCSRLPPPPVPPWLRESPSRLQQLTRRCRRWTVYQELCNPGSENSTWNYYPSSGGTSEEEGWQKEPWGMQWVIPGLALVVLALLMVLALVIYKYYYSRNSKKSVYRVSGAGYRFKPSQSGGGSWTGGPLMESDTAESYLSQTLSSAAPQPHPPPALPGHARSPVCRLLEHTQYVATPTEDDHRPRPPSGPPAFASPAYFLPALSWLRLPALRQAWPGAEVSGTPGGSAVYSAARPVPCDCGESVVHRWMDSGESQAAASAVGSESATTDNGPEYSEIWEGPLPPPPPQYSSLSQTPAVPPRNGLGPYEYEMQETVDRRPVCDCDPSFPHHTRAGSRAQGGGYFAGSDHGYEKLWQGSEGGDPFHGPKESCSTNMGTCEKLNGWLSRYRLPTSHIMDQRGDLEADPRHAHRPHRPHPRSWREAEPPAHPHRTDGQGRGGSLNSDSDFLPCQCSARDHQFIDTSSAWEAEQNRQADGRSEVKYANPVYEGHGTDPPCVAGPSPLLSRLWGYVGLNNRT